MPFAWTAIGVLDILAGNQVLYFPTLVTGIVSHNRGYF